MTRRLDVSVDLHTERLLNATKALQAGDWLPTETGKQVVKAAQGIRLAMMAQAPNMAKAHLTTVAAVVQSIGPSDDMDETGVRLEFGRLVDAVAIALNKAAS